MHAHRKQTNLMQEDKARDFKQDRQSAMECSCIKSFSQNSLLEALTSGSFILGVLYLLQFI